MYILFINSSGKCDLPPKKKKVANVIFFFLLNLIIIVIKKNCLTQGFNPTQPNVCGLCWIGLDLCDGLS